MAAARDHVPPAQVLHPQTHVQILHLLLPVQLRTPRARPLHLAQAHPQARVNNVANH